MSVVAGSTELIRQALLSENPWRALITGATPRGARAAATLWAGAVLDLEPRLHRDARPSRHSCLDAALFKAKLASSNIILVWATAPIFLISLRNGKKGYFDLI